MSQKTDLPDTSFASRLSYKLQDKSDKWDHSVRSATSQSSLKGRWRPGQTVTRHAPDESALEKELPNAAFKQEPIYRRAITRLNRFRLKTMINLAYHGMGLLSSIDELLVKYLRGNPNKKQSLKSGRDLSSAKSAQDMMKFLATASDKQIQEMRLKAQLQYSEAAQHKDHDEFALKKVRKGVLIRDDPNSLCGEVYPHGIPASELPLYTRPRLLVVKEGSTNKFGHALLAFGDPTSGKDRYVQISSANWYPEHMTGEQVADYFAKAQNKVAYEVYLDCDNEDAMRGELNNLSSRPWRWGGTLHNCMTLAKEIAVAGESPLELFDGFTTISNRFSNNFQGSLESSFQRVLIRTSREHPELVDKLSQLEDHLNQVLLNPVNLPEYVTDAHSPEQAIKVTLKKAKKIVKASDLPRKQQKLLMKRLTRETLTDVRRRMASTYREVHGQSARNLLDMPMVSAYNMPVANRVVGPQSIAAFNEDPEAHLEETRYFVDLTPLQDAVDNDLFAATIKQAKQDWPAQYSGLCWLEGELHRQVSALPKPEIFTTVEDIDLNDINDHLVQVLNAIEVTVDAAGFPDKESDELFTALSQLCTQNIYSQLSQEHIAREAMGSIRKSPFVTDNNPKDNKSESTIPESTSSPLSLQEAETEIDSLSPLSEDEIAEQIENMFTSVAPLPDHLFDGKALRKPKPSKSKPSDEPPPPDYPKPSDEEDLLF